MLEIKNLKKTNMEDIEEKIDEVLEFVNLLSEKNMKVSKLSGGMTRRLGIAQALINDPELLIFDEPTAGLDPEERLRFKTLISQISKDKTVLISTHIIEDLEALCDKILVMKEGLNIGFLTNEELAKKAENKVYEIKKDELKNIRGRYYTVKEYRQGDESFARILTDEPQELESIPPNSEDGYLWLSRQIFG